MQQVKIKWIVLQGVLYWQSYMPSIETMTQDNTTELEISDH